MRKEFTRSYVKENIPKKSYVRTHFVLRNRRPGEFYWSEILAIIFVIVVFTLLVMNYFYNRNSAESRQLNETADEKVIHVGASIEKKLDGCKPDNMYKASAKSNL
jgi:hypothetical protein